MPDANEFLNPDDSNANHEISALPPTVSALLGEHGRAAQRTSWDRLRAVCVDLQLTPPNLSELQTQKLRAGPFVPPKWDERRESRDEYKRRCERECKARPQMDHGDTCLVVVTNTENINVELDVDAGCVTADMGDK